MVAKFRRQFLPTERDLHRIKPSGSRESRQAPPVPQCADAPTYRLGPASLKICARGRRCPRSSTWPARPDHRAADALGIARSGWQRHINIDPIALPTLDLRGRASLSIVPSSSRHAASSSRQLMNPGPAISTAVTPGSASSFGAISPASARGLVPAALASTIAALVARSPCAASRGGSTATFFRSRSAGNAPSPTSPSSTPSSSANIVNKRLSASSAAHVSSPVMRPRIVRQRPAGSVLAVEWQSRVIPAKNSVPRALLLPSHANIGSKVTFGDKRGTVGDHPLRLDPHAAASRCCRAVRRDRFNARSSACTLWRPAVAPAPAHIVDRREPASHPRASRRARRRPSSRSRRAPAL